MAQNEWALSQAALDLARKLIDKGGGKFYGDTWSDPATFLL